MLDANLAAIRSRFPRVAGMVEYVETPAYAMSVSPCPVPIVKGLQIVSGYDRAREAQTQSSALPSSPSEAWCYGLGLGSLPRAVLARPDARKVIAVSLSASLLRLALSLEDQRDWLLDPRLYLVHGSDLGVVYGPRCVSAGELAHADPSCHRLRDELEIELNRSFHRVQFTSQYDDDKANLDRAAALTDEHVSALIAREKRPGRYVVCAGGPTLDTELSWLRAERARDPSMRVVSATAALRTLARGAVVPDYVVAIDSSGVDTAKQVDSVDLGALAGAALVYDQVVPLALMEAWQGRRAWAVTGLEGDLWADGTVTHAATDLAVKLGATEVTLLGADFCYAYDRTHSEAVTYGSAVADGPAMRHTIDGEGRDVLTISSLTHMRRRLERYIAAHREVTFCKRGRAGVPLEGVRWAA